MSITKLTPDNSEKFLEGNKDKFVIIVFDAEFSGQKELVKDAIKALETYSQNNNNVIIASADAEINDDLATKFTVLSVPIIVCVSNESKTIKKIDTFEPEKLIKNISQHVDKTSLSFKNQQGGEECKADRETNFNEYLKKLTNKAPVMIFMKGEPSAPRCGFSKQLVAILSKHDIVYDYFDILEDDEVRQGLKTFSDWPTYPQIYCKGEFIGGLDILKQMEETGEIQSTLKF